MALSAWKRFERSPGYQRKKRFLRRLFGKELRLRPEMDVPLVTAGGWCFMPGGLDPSCVVYSLGVGDSIGFDLHVVAEYGAEVHAFDPTPSSLEMLASRELPGGFHLHPWAVTGADGPVAFRPRPGGRDGRGSAMYSVAPAGLPGAIEVPGFTLPTIAATLGHEEIAVLKMDIEGAEYGVLDGLLDSPLRPAQVLVEFHHRFPERTIRETRRAVVRLREAGYRTVAVSNTGREVSFVHRSALPPGHPPSPLSENALPTIFQAPSIL